MSQSDITRAEKLGVSLPSVRGDEIRLRMGWDSSMQSVIITRLSEKTQGVSLRDSETVGFLLLFDIPISLSAPRI